MLLGSLIADQPRKSKKGSEVQLLLRLSELLRAFEKGLEELEVLVSKRLSRQPFERHQFARFGESVLILFAQAAPLKKAD